MPSKTRDERTREKPNEEDGPKSHSTTRSRDKDRHSRSSRGQAAKRSSTKGKDKDREHHHPLRRHARSSAASSTTSLRDNRRDSGNASDSNSRPHSASFADSRASLPYPTFSKAHSREAVGSRDNLPPKLNVLTPEPTDVTADNHRQNGEKPRNSGGNSNNNNNTTNNNNNTKNSGDKTHGRNHSAQTSPPSPPLTNDGDPVRRRSTPGPDKKTEQKRPTKLDEEDGKHHSRTGQSPHPSRSSSASTKKAAPELAHSRSARPSTPGKFKILDAFQFPHRAATQHVSPSSSVKQKSHEKSGQRRSSGQRASPPSPRDSVVTEKSAAVDSTPDSDATYTARNQAKAFQPDTPSDERKSAVPASPAPPPPPPAPDVPASTPRVDYLLQNGGLGYHVPRNLLGAGESANMPQELFRPDLVGTRLFGPFSALLDDYNSVMEKNGSLAVATGYRSVARRLLDRLEAVFARDISSETCGCIMCGWKDQHPDEEASGVSWGEILELVSGRQDLPPWPPFNIGTETGASVGLSVTEQHVPMQKLDIDVPEEYREQFIRQSKKTKDAVDKWLSRQPNDSHSSSDDFDDETLAFAMLTYLDGEQRDIFRCLLEMPAGPPEPKRETPKPKNYRPETIVRICLALQRLYRLPKEPRDPETALYMVGNPQMHNVLATLAAISNDEWDILISGRFDGFLRSGVESDDPNSARPLTGRTSSSRISPGITSPAKVNGGRVSCNSNRSTTYSGPASFGAPISVDEETEIAALAEIERDIFLGMEALEDAFETLHGKAETVRRAVRERGAGMTAARARRGVDGLGGGGAGVEVLTGTPAQASRAASTTLNGDETAMDDGLDDAASIAPSDSASNISSSRRRRPKRRTERRTPAAVEEEDEEGY